MNMKLDKIDLAILRELQADASRSSEEIAAAVGLTQSPCWKRIKNLKDMQVIKKRVVQLDRKKLGFRILTFVHVALNRSDTKSLTGFENMVSRIPQIVSCHTVLGDADFMLQICAEDMERLQQVLSRLWSHPDISSITSHVVLKTPKPFDGYPIFDE